VSASRAEPRVVIIGGVAKRSRGVQAAESRADDHDARFRAS